MELLLTELATNAIRHARTPFTVTLSWDGQSLRGEVSDVNLDPLLPQQHAAANAFGGRGLLLVQNISSTWGIEPHEHGKTVWFTLDPDGPDGDAEG